MREKFRLVKIETDQRRSFQARGIDVVTIGHSDGKGNSFSGMAASLSERTIVDFCGAKRCVYLAEDTRCDFGDQVQAANVFIKGDCNLIDQPSDFTLDLDFNTDTDADVKTEIGELLDGDLTLEMESIVAYDY